MELHANAEFGPAQEIGYLPVRQVAADPQVDQSPAGWAQRVDDPRSGLFPFFVDENLFRSGGGERRIDCFGGPIAPHPVDAAAMGYGSDQGVETVIDPEARRIDGVMDADQDLLDNVLPGVLRDVVTTLSDHDPGKPGHGCNRLALAEAEPYV